MPNSTWHPAPQYASLEPHQPAAEQHDPKTEPAHDMPLALPQVVATGITLMPIPPLLTVALAETVQPPISVTITLYVPAVRLVALAVVCTGLVFHE